QVRLYLRTRHRDRLVFSEQAIAALADAFVPQVKEPVELSDRLAVCLQRLTERARDICRLRYQEGRRPNEIAAQLSQTAESVRKILQRARESLRECLNATRPSMPGEVP
ncbi:MAG: sigma-70 family RNA polymerase sigma factor, partial [Planctomycetaceae bacterium]